MSNLIKLISKIQSKKKIIVKTGNTECSYSKSVTERLNWGKHKSWFINLNEACVCKECHIDTWVEGTP